MSAWAWLLVSIAALCALYVGLVLTLLLLGRGRDIRAVAGFGPDCAVLLSRLARDSQVPRRRRLLIAVAAAYIASPIDLIPDFVPVLGYVDDVVVIALLLRCLPRGVSEERLQQHWPGPPSSLQVVLRASGVRRTPDP